MKRLRLILCAIGVGGCSVTAAGTSDAPRALPSDATMPSDAAGRATWLVHYITALADAGGVDSQADLAAIFPHGYSVVPVRHFAFPSACATTGQMAAITSDSLRLDGTWFHAMPDGVAHMQYPGFTINPAGETGAPSLTFSRQQYPCEADRWRYNSSTIAFDNLPAFACITGTALVAAAPGVREERITDGGIGFAYGGKTDQDTSVDAEFTGRFGGPCLISATIKRTSGMGYRRLRAVYKWQTCLRRSGAEFCKAHPEFQFSYPPDRAMLSLMDAKQQHVIGECGNLDNYYNKEPAEGGVPPPITESAPRLQRVCPQ